jgi:hypothetical protein
MKQGRIQITLFVLFLFLSITSLFAGRNIVNQDHPKKGKHIFPIKEVWRITGGQDILFGNIVTIAVSDSEHVFARDVRNREYYAIDKEGHLLTAFGKHGEGPGQVRRPGRAGIRVFKNKVMIEDPDKIHHFDDRGRYLKSVRKTRRVSLFLSENEYISAPASIAGLASDQAKMRYVNLETGQETVITDFTLFKSGVLQIQGGTANVILPSITPVMILGHHNGRLYYGMNNRYTIYITDTRGTDYGCFSLKREGEKVSLKERENVLIELAKGYGPRELAIRMAKTLPDRQTCFSSIVSHDGKLYIIKSHFVPVNYQEIDIFSPEGHYLYQGIIKIEEEARIKTRPVFKNDHVYLVIEDENGEIYIAKYHTTLPG